MFPTFSRLALQPFAILDAAEPGDDCSMRRKNPDFPLNLARYEGAGILLGHANFGCGSSREHAVWALSEWGIRALVAPSFAEISRGLPETVVGLFEAVQSTPAIAWSSTCTHRPCACRTAKAIPSRSTFQQGDAARGPG
jgi:Aconitase C-terminal domain